MNNQFVTNPTEQSLVCRRRRFPAGSRLIEDLQQKHRMNISSLTAMSPHRKSDERNLAWWRSPDILEYDSINMFNCTRDDLSFDQSQTSCIDWSKMQVANWLIQNGYERYRKMFNTLNIDGKKLAQLDANDMRRMGVRSWADCQGLAHAVQVYTSRRTLNPEDYQNKIYPYYPELYVGEQITPTDFQQQRIPPKQKTMFRIIYKASGDNFYFYDKRN
ncbi:protein pob1 [Biomphalaria pfeifferi]|uniref:Protein pob1 n=1 Tax=Biomphalaria pfeifferi TaxID=112525 RepID=A0AAD8BRL7_BIOPF|nr:protein pob1 [Biomphalaria pfeifferi]